MKTYYFLIISLFASNQLSAQWTTFLRLPLDDSSHYSSVAYSVIDGCIFIDANTVLFSGSAIRNDTSSLFLLFKSTDRGNTWSILKEGKYAFYPLVRASANTLVAGSKYLSTDNGLNWDTLDNGINSPKKDLACFDSVCYAKYPDNSDKRFYKSSDLCKTWVLISDSVSLAPKGFDAVNKHVVFRVKNASGSPAPCRIFKTIDQGQNWTCSRGLGLPFLSDAYFDFVSEQIGYMNSSSRLYKTIDGGLNWDTIHPVQAAHLGRFSFMNEYVGFTRGDRIRKTIDGGVTWIDQDVIPAIAGEYRCINDTICWITSNVNPVRIYYTLNQGGGPIRLSTGVTQHNQTHLSDLMVYPNPAQGGNFDIKWTIEQTGIAEVRVYNVYGRTVYQLEKYSDKTGSQHVTMQVSMAPGIYFVQVQQNGKVATKRIVLN